MSPNAYLEAFRRGPCSPVIVLPGIIGTKLRMEVDCKLLKEKHPDVFESCGWTTCSSSIFSFSTSSPKKEYNLWIPDFNAPFSLVNSNSKTNKCLPNVISFGWNAQTKQIVRKPIAGIIISPMGYTKETRTNSRCGFDAISQLIGIAFDFLLPKSMGVFQKFREALERAGYKVGLTAQALPYDWRKAFYDNEVGLHFITMAERMVDMIGKKVSIVAHSYGNMNLLNVFSKTTQQKKDKLINKYFALGPPYIGAPKALHTMIGANSQFSLGDGFGISSEAFSRIVQTPSVYDLMPRRGWTLFKDTTWMKSIKNRIARESAKPNPFQLTDQEDIVSKIFPGFNENCFEKKFTETASQQCASGLSDYSNFGTIAGDLVDVDHLPTLLGKYAIVENARYMYEQEVNQGNYDTLTNPGVAVIIVYLTALPTLTRQFYNDDPTKITKSGSNKFVTPNRVENTPGDGSVPAISSLLPGLKWAHEFSQKQAGAKPVVFAEVCSIKARRQSVQKFGRDVADNDYHGVACECKSSVKDCDHAGMVSDANVVEYLVQSLADNQKPTAVAKPLSDADLKRVVDQCELLNLL